MKINPIKNQLYTDNDFFIKTLVCPFQVKWNEMQLAASEKSRICNHCAHEVVDTAFLTDEEALKLVEENPKTCFKVNFNQENIQIIE